MKEKEYGAYKEAINAEKEIKFRGIPLISNYKLSVINSKQFLASLTDTLKRRCFTTKSFNVKSNEHDSGRDDYAQLLTDINYFDSESWPTALNVLYGQAGPHLGVWGP